MKKRPGLIYKLVMVLLALIFTTLACGSFPSAAKPVPTKPVKPPVATKAPLPTDVPQPDPTESAAPTAEPAPEQVDTPEATAAPVVEGPGESWRIPPFKGATLLAYDQTANIDPNWVSLIDHQARNLAMPKPYYFEIYDLPMGTNYIAIRDYYNEQITQGAMKKAFDDMGSNGIAVATWVGTSVKNRKYLVQYMPAKDKYVPWMFIMYSNPQ